MPTGFQQGIDCAVFRGDNGKVYFFKNGRYVRFSNVSAGVDKGYPRTIGANWKWLPTDFTNRLGAALWDHSKGRIYFFQGNDYVRSSDVQNLDAGYPKNIRNNWRRVPIGAATFDPKGQSPGVFKIRAH